MDLQNTSPELDDWILARVTAGESPEAVVAVLLARGWKEHTAIDAIDDAVRRHLARHAQDAGLPVPARVPAPVAWNGASRIDVGDRHVQVLAHLVHPHVVVFGGLLADDECDALIGLARGRVQRSPTLDPDTGRDQIHPHRTSRGVFLQRGCNALLRTIEARIARLTGWPLENGESVPLLNYGVGAEYRPHYDYFDPERPGNRATLARGGQRVATLVMYLDTPDEGGATTFPDVGFEVAAIRGNAVFFSYDRPHPMTRTLHGGAPVLAGEKWVATKWLREGRHV